MQVRFWSEIVQSVEISMRSDSFRSTKGLYFKSQPDIEDSLEGFAL